jgi:hypothetical protein
MTVKAGAVLVLTIAGALLLRELFPKREVVASPPRIQTVHDTVRAVDTLWLKRQVRVDTLLLERISVTPPETVRIAPRLVGMTGLVVAPFVGDSTVLQGFRGAPVDSGYTVTQWQAQFYTSGPLQAVGFVNGTPAVRFGPPLPKPFGFFQRVKLVVLGMGIGAAGWELVR